MYLISFYVPETHLEKVKVALFEAGAGRIGAYEYCAWQTRGEGQFRPLKGSHPFLGEEGKIEKVPEYKVELVCEESLIKKIIQALKTTHPYETPAYHILNIMDFEK